MGRASQGKTDGQADARGDRARLCPTRSPQGRLLTEGWSDQRDGRHLDPPGPHPTRSSYLNICPVKLMQGVSLACPCGPTATWVASFIARSVRGALWLRGLP